MQKRITQKQALIKLQRYCAYQERCHAEVTEKLSSLGIWGDWANEIIVDLIEERFLNEERYACSLVRGKFKYKQWGRNKIIQRLKQKKISPYLIKHSLKELNEEDYIKTIQKLIEKKDKRLRDEDVYKRKQKIVNYLLQKGYESPLIWKHLNSYFEKKGTEEDVL